jgi:hypothetical protein
VNPPRFSWSYTPNPADTDKDQAVRSFQFQAAYDTDFRKLAVNVRTASNLYNTIAPFKEDTVYWRVGYIEAGEDQPRKWSETRRFTIAADAIKWDRSMLADETYLRERGAHPHILFNAQNRRLLYQYLERRGGKAWALARRAAEEAVNSSWWHEIDPNKGIKDGQRARYIANVAFVWQLTRDQKYLEAKPQEALVQLARNYLDIKGDRKDVITQLPGGGGEMIRALGFGYDWLYEVMTPAQRQEVLKAIESNCQFMVNAFWWRYPKNSSLKTADPLGNYPGGFIVPRQSAAKIGTSHGINNFQYALVAALAAYPESSKVREFFDLGVNYMIGRTYPYGSDGGMNQGRPYSATEGVYGKTVLDTAILYQIAFPEVKFNLNPFFKLQSDWWNRVAPVGFVQGHEP